MSADKRRLQCSVVPIVPPMAKLMKHSQSEYHSKLPEIKTIKGMRQTIEPVCSEFKLRTSTCRASSMKKLTPATGKTVQGHPQQAPHLTPQLAGKSGSGSLMPKMKNYASQRQIFAT